MDKSVLDDNTFLDIDLDTDLKEMYKILGNESQINQYNKQEELSKLRDLNYKRYNLIEIENILLMKEFFKYEVIEIKNLYKKIDSKNIYNLDLNNSYKLDNQLNYIENKINELDKKIIKTKKDIENSINKKEKKYNLDYFNSLGISDSSLNKIKQIYDEILTINPHREKSIYLELIKQIKINDKYYLIKDIINSNKNKITDPNYIKIKNYLDNIIYKYIDRFDDTDKEYIKELYYDLKRNPDMSYMLERTNELKNKTWQKTITNIYEYNENDDFYFICSNNQFIDKKYETILITKKELNKVDTYDNYQIGFICSYNNNILYTTEHKDIMEVKDTDLKDIKDPISLEEDFQSFDNCDRIALDGFNTKIEAVYYIEDFNKDCYFKALELANMYNLPLIKLKR